MPPEHPALSPLGGEGGPQPALSSAGVGRVRGSRRCAWLIMRKFCMTYTTLQEWNTRYHRFPVPPLPKRVLPGERAAEVPESLFGPRGS